MFLWVIFAMFVILEVSSIGADNRQPVTSGLTCRWVRSQGAVTRVVLTGHTFNPENGLSQPARLGAFVALLADGSERRLAAYLPEPRDLARPIAPLSSRSWRFSRLVDLPATGPGRPVGCTLNVHGPIFGGD